MHIRAYEPRDRAAVRAICHLTGFMGDPVDWLWRDRESFADVFTGYWTDREPESALVVETNHDDAGDSCKVIGYLLGCVDTRAVPSLVTTIWPHLCRRALAFQPGTAGVLWRALGDVIIDILLERKLPTENLLDDRWPSHLHIDLLPEARGHGVGRELVTLHLERLRSLGSPGCHLQTIRENKAAVAFFESVGFHLHGESRLAPGWRSRSGERLHTQIMVQSL
jgi:ribosomal protein S18 acetylase RimI-like enzyme